MRAILVGTLHLTQHFLFGPKTAAAHYGAYISLVYLAAADRRLRGRPLAFGTRRAVVFGALLLIAGHMTTGHRVAKPATQTLTYGGPAPTPSSPREARRGEAESPSLVVGDKPYAVSAAKSGDFVVEGLSGRRGRPPPGRTVPPAGRYSLDVAGRDPEVYMNVLWLALSLIIVGVGYLKPNISTIVGQLYPQGDPRRDPGFTLYYFRHQPGGLVLGPRCCAASWASRSAGGRASVRPGGPRRMLAGFVVFMLAAKPLLRGKRRAAGSGPAAPAGAGPGEPRDPDPCGSVAAGRRGDRVFLVRRTAAVQAAYWWPAWSVRSATSSGSCSPAAARSSASVWPWPCS
ncbi:hypothetical protein ACRAWD_09515 [Caulobacter segnis]